MREEERTLLRLEQRNWIIELQRFPRKIVIYNFPLSCLNVWDTILQSMMEWLIKVSWWIFFWIACAHLPPYCQLRLFCGPQVINWYPAISIGSSQRFLNHLTFTWIVWGKNHNCKPFGVTAKNEEDINAHSHWTMLCYRWLNKYLGFTIGWNPQVSSMKHWGHQSYLRSRMTGSKMS